MQGREGETLGGFDYMWTLADNACSTSTVSTYTGPKKRERGQVSVLLGSLKCSTDGSIDGQDYQLMF